MAHDAFISHSTQDKAVADAVCAILEQRGIRCWIAPRDVEPGADWGAALLQAIKRSRLLVLVLSRAANASPHIIREVERAVHFGVIVVPLRIEDVMPEGALEYHLGTVHWLDALTPPREAHLARLAATVLRILEDRTARDEGKAGAGEERPSPTARIEENPSTLSPLLKPESPSRDHWDRKNARTFVGHDDSAVLSVSVSPDGKQLVTADNEGTIVLWDVEAGTIVGRLIQHADAVWSVCFSLDGRYIASGSRDQTVGLWSAADGEHLRTMTVMHEPSLWDRATSNVRGVQGIRSVAFSADSRLLISGSDNGDVDVWNPATGRRVVTFRHGMGLWGVNSVAAAPTGDRIASAGHGGVMLWDLASRKLISRVSNQHAHTVAFSADGDLIGFSSEYGSSIKVVRLSDRTEVPLGSSVAEDGGGTMRKFWRSLKDGPVLPGVLAFRPDSQTVAIYRPNVPSNSISLIALNDGSEIRALEGHSESVSSLAFDSRGRYLASGSHDATAMLWDLECVLADEE